MRFISRSLMGLMLLTLTFALLALAGNSIFSAFTVGKITTVNKNIGFVT